MAPSATTANHVEFDTNKSKVKSLQLDGNEDHDLVLRSFRVLIADVVQQFNGGHPGGAMGMAAIGVALWAYTMRYSPEHPDWFNRDRFVLSNGHTCLFQYTFLHLAGYKHMTMNQLKTYHSASEESLCPGHPEIEHTGIEVTTGPLGQGIANAVGLAMATKNLAATYNKPGYDVVSNTTWCMTGDACLQEGVGLEAISLAGHWKLNNLVLIFDNNNVTCDGSADIAVSEDINAKMAASGWNVIEIMDGSHDIQGIVAALKSAKESTDKPTFINCHTIIGVGSAVAGDAKAHGAAFGQEDVDNIHKINGFKAEDKFNVPEKVYNFFKTQGPSRGANLVQEWEDLKKDYCAEHSKLGLEFQARVKGKLPNNWEDFIPKDLPTSATATRKSAGLICNPLAQNIPNFMVGTADLSPSVYMAWPDKVDFQSPDLITVCGINGNYSGRYIHYGIREHAMAAIANGLAAFNPGTIVPVTSSFFMFYLYAAPGIRMGALQELQAIHIATHDSIGTGEDGPTHQPIEIAALYRAMPNLLYIRPSDSEETAGAFTVALKAKHNATIISTSRQNLPQNKESRRDAVKYGAYVLREKEDATVTIIGVGAEMCFAIEAAEQLAQDRVSARIVSFPCQRLFEQQTREYRRSTLQSNKTVAVVVEAYAANGWERYANASISMKTFGKSLPGKVAYEYFGFNGKVIAGKIQAYLEDLKQERIWKSEFVEL
ncbi:Transketolase, thiamine diphosphate binding domain-containing protein [Amylocarpus encephaloides]|uniref:transketolase n=1 Tax=Amylocarpus encephaloides TaxID=45428 RepID=A0A9P7YQW8_9HELO|nr:Transketolase, thiamine diphosphate binding domain-containing protein [Amylocarpus encephaloides]